MEEERDVALPVSYTSSSSIHVSGDLSGSAPSSSSSSSESVQEEENHNDQEQTPELQQQRTSVSYRVNISISDVTSTEMREDAWSFLVVLLTFWFFSASMTVIMGFYGSINLQLGPSYSRLVQVNTIFVQNIKVQEVVDSKPGPILYGFYKHPPLDVETTWSETRNISISPNDYKEWLYYLNEGSEINISYSVKSQSSSPLSLVIAKGKENLVEWCEDPSYPNTTLSWNIVHGDGVIQQKIFTSSDYYVAVGNMDSEEAEATDENWYIKLSYGPRWIAYFVGSGGMTILILLTYKIYNKFQSTVEDETQHQSGDVRSEREPLLSPKDDLSSLGSSYDSVSHDEDLEEWFAENSLDSKPLKDGNNINNPPRLCAICFDSPRDCFFLPCGHLAACFTCGTRIAEEAGTCPICRRKMKKVRKIFTI
ncbi:E3 ubiquitin-protein ligase APD2-like isoform X3 [Macadamia integrifolia]|uniref:E3 ubiquitin-protein ligase APD2-like isoform X3 n=1 Tax=Macadamia integrifolia TaxID=60698 RepID=UPI001C4F91D1|nr:E3 ubiquitin-protein ligase APD2-like isoform X3 [Macadamia integrifolia]